MQERLFEEVANVLGYFDKQIAHCSGNRVFELKLARDPWQTLLEALNDCRHSEAMWLAAAGERKKALELAGKIGRSKTKLADTFGEIYRQKRHWDIRCAEHDLYTGLHAVSPTLAGAVKKAMQRINAALAQAPKTGTENMDQVIERESAVSFDVSMVAREMKDYMKALMQLPRLRLAGNLAEALWESTRYMGPRAASRVAKEVLPALRAGWSAHTFPQG